MRVLGRLALIVFGVILAFIAAELTLRVLAPNENRNSGRLYVKDWAPDYSRPRLLPNTRAVHRGVEIVTNSIGLRDREIAVPKPEGTYRIVMLGDSFVFGQGIPRLEDTLPKQLEARLNAAGHPEVEVVNSGIAGLNTFEEYLTYEQQARKLQPDMAILVWEGYRLMYAALESLALSCARDGVALHVVIYPALRALDSDYYQNLIYSKVERRCVEDGISCVNLFPAFRGRNPEDLHVSIMDAHPNAHANAIAAEALADELLAPDELPAP